MSAPIRGPEPVLTAGWAGLAAVAVPRRPTEASLCSRRLVTFIPPLPV